MTLQNVETFRGGEYFCKALWYHRTPTALIPTRFKRSMSTRTSSLQPATAPRSSHRPSSWVSSHHWSCCSSSPTPCTWWSTSSTSTATKSTRPQSTSPEAQKPKALRRTTCSPVGSPANLQAQRRTVWRLWTLKPVRVKVQEQAGDVTLRAFPLLTVLLHSQDCGRTERADSCRILKLEKPRFVSTTSSHLFFFSFFCETNHKWSGSEGEPQISFKLAQSTSNLCRLSHISI